MCLVEMWHCPNTLCLCFRHLQSKGFPVVDKLRPQPSTKSLMLSTNHGGMAIVSVPGVLLALMQLASDPVTFEFQCTHVQSVVHLCHHHYTPARFADCHIGVLRRFVYDLGLHRWIQRTNLHRWQL